MITTATPTATATDRLENVHPEWDDQRDGTFFRIVAHLLPSATVFAAAVLLESYDPAS